MSAAWPWLAFTLFVLLMLAIDAIFLQQRDRNPSLAVSAISVGFWCAAALAVAITLWLQRGATVGTQFLAGYLLEWSMSLDNIFVFAVLFRYFQVPRQYQYQVLFWGIVGAVAMRLAFILVGAALIERFQYMLPTLGLFLVYTSVQFVWNKPDEIDPRKNVIFRLARRWLPLAQPLANDGNGLDATSNNATGNMTYIDPILMYGRGFFVRENNKFVATGLFLVLLVIESTDLLFAVDSIPAILGITRDPFIVFSSNLMAILGLRSLYFLLAGALDLFRYLHLGLAAILAFVGLKMIADAFWPHAEGTELLPVWVSLIAIGGLLAVSIAVSLVLGRKH